jgi:hypothetical protein
MKPIQMLVGSFKNANQPGRACNPLSSELSYPFVDAG